jgi:hypothetical protein
MNNRHKALSALALAVAGLVTAKGLVGAHASSSDGAAVFATATSITLVQDRIGEAGKEIRLSVTNSTDVRRLTAAIRLEKKDPCWCLHLHHATFEAPTKSIEVSFCGHCFDVVEAKGVGNYKMPKGFYSELRKQISEHSKEQWLLPEP